MELLALLTVGFLGYFVIIPAATYFRHERDNRLRWRRQSELRLPESDPGGPFRQRTDAEHDYIVEEWGAPRMVKVVSVTSLVLGHMFLPGLLAGLIGLPFYGLGLVSIPGLWLCSSIYRNAAGLLRCDPKAAVRARQLGRFAVALNVVVLLVVTVLLPFEEIFFLLAFTAIYACISIVHAMGLHAAADAIDAVHRGDAPWVEPSTASSALRQAA